jgi:hypothetical protein
MAAEDDNTLKAQLATRGFESISVIRRVVAGQVTVEASQLYPLDVAGEEPVYVPIPVSLSVKVDKKGRLRSLAPSAPSDEVVREAADFLRTLRERGDVAEEPGAAATEQQSAAPSRPTHQIVRDAQGRRVLRRRRISMF